MRAEDVPFKRASDGTSHSFFSGGGRVSLEGVADSGDETSGNGVGAPAPFRWFDKAQGPTVRSQKPNEINALSDSLSGSPFVTRSYSLCVLRTC
jgi:hypothetical protein